MTTNLIAAPAKRAERDPRTIAESAGGQGRRGFAAVSLIAGGVGALALAVPAGPVRLVMLLAFLLVGPGAGVMSQVAVADRLVSWALTVTASLTTACGAAVLMLWTHTWHPRAAVLVLVGAVVGAAVVRLVLDRSVAGRPRDVVAAIFTRPPTKAVPTEVEDVDAAPLGAPSAGAPQVVALSAAVAANAAAAAAAAPPAGWRRFGPAAPVALLLAAVALWVFSLIRFRPSIVDGYGMTTAVGFPFVAAVALLGIGFAIELFGRARTLVLTAVLVAVSAMMQATVPLLYRNLEYAWTYKHIGVVDLIRDNGHLLNSTDIYQQWPGFFATVALLSSVAGVDALAFAAWSSLTFALLNMLLLTALLRQFTSNRRVIALGVGLFGICMWVDIGYFSPQAFGYTLMLGFWLIVARWLVASPTVAEAPAGRLARVRAALLRGFPARTPGDRRTRVWAGLAATAVFAAITVSHQLTPFLMLVPAIVLAVLGVLRPRILVVVWGLVVVAFVAPRIPSVANEYGLFDFDLLSNAAGNASGWHTDQQRFSALVARCLAIGVWSVALFAIWRSRRRLGTVLLPAIGAFGPFVTLGGQSYGGEAIYRVFAFSMPFAALLIAGIWIGARRGVLVVVSSAVALSVVSLAALQGLQGQLVVHRVRPADVQAARYYYAHARPDSTLVLVAPNFPTKLAANYGSFNTGWTVDIALVGDPEFVGRLNSSRLPAVEQYMRNLGGRDNYLVVSTQMTVYTDYFGLLAKGSTRSLEDALRVSPRWQVFYLGSGVTIYRMMSVG